MGTRNLTMVIADGKTKVAQYGQWDGYPEGQGKTALSFLLTVNLADFKKKLQIVRFGKKKDEKERNDFLSSLGAKDGWLTMKQSAAYNKKYPFETRDNGAEILQMIMDSELPEIVLQDQTNFVADSLFCEWAYVIDLDKNTFEVYEGFNEHPLSEGERFFYLQANGEHIEKRRENQYYPAKLAKSYDLSNLPTIEQFLSDFKEAEETA